ncbi:protoheme IX farnesyltransferase [Bacillus sp. FJAT-25509]|uniref:heme o synthase n=1 Tax=Bacillaceae TaxID=186817 RepID=UPI0006F4DA65|nr:heme o synthase [Bacillus sp. FJAT-25509]KQL41820.1 protoheme IX farnesyltransferase [Bacillus sp. FJAT-25509]
MNQIQTKSSKNFFKNLISLIKGKVFVINVLPVLAGYFLSSHINHIPLAAHIASFFVTLIGSAFVIAGALMLNNWYEADLDKQMERTKNRPSATGEFSKKFVLTLGVTTSIMGFFILFFTNAEVLLFSFVGWFFYVVLYTFWSKQKYSWNTIIGAVSGCVTPLIGWSVLSSSFQLIPMMMALIVFIWQMPHTYSIAIRRFDDYKRAGFAMLPVVSGVKKTKIHLLFYLICLIPMPFFMKSLGLFFIGFMTILNIGWIILSISGFATQNEAHWAKWMFRYSVIHMMLFLISIIVMSI